MGNKGSVNHNLSITDVISTAGWEKIGNTSYRGSHPEHGSKTGTNTVVDTADNVAYCFRHQSGGDPLLWIAHLEGILHSCSDMESGALTGEEFIETCKIANQKYGANIEIEDIDETEVEKRGRARQVLEKAQELTHGQLKQNKEKWNRIKQERNLKDEDLEEIKIGYWNETVTQTLKKRFSTESLVNSGLFKINCPDQDCDLSFKNIENLEQHTNSSYSKEQLYPIIGDRITFPYKRYNKVLYFIGRRTKEREDYWYSEADNHAQEITDNILNNPDTDAETFEEAKNTWVSRKCGKYVKICQTSYNDHIIWQKLKDRDELVITEGIYDAISAHKAGYSIASPITTRFNSNDINKVVDIAKDFEKVHLIFDGDTAGKEGQQETAKRLTQEGVEPNLITLESGKDLDDWTNENSYNIEKLLEEGDRFLDTLLQKAEEADGREEVKIREEIYRITHNWDEREARWIFKELQGRTAANKRDWKEVGEEIRENKQQEQKRQQLPDQQEPEDGEEDEITEKLEINGSDKVIHINPRPSVYVNQVEETATETKINEVGTVQKNPVFKVFEVQFGEGQEENTYKLLVEPWKQLNLGENNLPIKKANLKKSKYYNSEYFREKYQEIKSNVDGFSQSYDEWIQSREGSEYIELQEQIDSRSKATVKELSNDSILEIVREYLQAAWYTDPKLRSVMYPQIVQHDKSKTKPGNIAKYQPHTQMWTNTKVGKSNTARRVGRKYDDATPAGLLGYADSDGKQEGIIDGLDKPVFIDEFNFGASSRQLNDQLLSLMEEGYYEQLKAGHSVKTRFYGNMTYLANPKDGDLPAEDEQDDQLYSEYSKKERSSFELVSQFEELIQFLGMNIQAMASRFGVIVFDEEMDQAEAYEEVELSDERFDKLETFVEWIKDRAGREYTEIERQLREWLEQGYEEEYQERIEELASDTHNEKVKKFWKNHIHSYRHARGQALRMAVFQHLGDVVKGEYDINKIREEAEIQWETVKEINRESLENMTRATDESQEISRARSKIDTYDPKYLRLFMKSIIKYHQENEDDIGMIKVFDDLKPVYRDLKEELPDEDVQKKSRYWKWSKLRKQVADNLNKKRLNVKQDFGVELFRRSGEEMFRVKVPERFQKFAQLSIPEDQDSGNDDDDHGGDDNDGVSWNKELKIDGDYDASQNGLMRLFEENEDRYDNREIPESDLINYFGRRFNGRKQNDLQKSLESLSESGDLREGPTGEDQTWIRVVNH